MVMKQVSIQALKATLSAVVAAAEAGETIEITRHNTPVARLSPARSPHVHYGTRVGQGRIEPALKGRPSPTKGRYLAVLLEDRGDR